MSDKPTDQNSKIEAEPERLHHHQPAHGAELLDGRRAWPGRHAGRRRPEVRYQEVAGLPSDKICNIIGKPHPAMPEVVIPRLTGKAEYATRVISRTCFGCKLLASPHPRARVKSLDVSKAEKMPGVAYVLTAQNAPKTYPFPTELVLPGRSRGHRGGGDRGSGRGCRRGHPGGVRSSSFRLQPAASHGAECAGPEHSRLMAGNDLVSSRRLFEWGEVDKAFSQADVVKEFTYSFAGAIPVPFAADGLRCQVGWRQADDLGHGPGDLRHSRNTAAKQLGIPAENIRFINKWNGGTFGGAMPPATKFYPWIAYIAKQTNRPVKITASQGSGTGAFCR